MRIPGRNPTRRPARRPPRGAAVPAPCGAASARAAQAPRSPRTSPASLPLVQKGGERPALGVRGAGPLPEVLRQRGGGRAQPSGTEQEVPPAFLEPAALHRRQPGDEPPAVGDEDFVSLADDVEEGAQ